MLALTEAPEMALNPVSGCGPRGPGPARLGENRSDWEGETKRSEGVGERKRLDDLT